MQRSTIRIPFEVIIAEDIRIISPSGEYIPLKKDKDCPIARLIFVEIEKSMNALKAVVEKEKNIPERKVDAT